MMRRRPHLLLGRRRPRLSLSPSQPPPPHPSLHRQIRLKIVRVRRWSSTSAMCTCSSRKRLPDLCSHRRDGRSSWWPPPPKTKPPSCMSRFLRRVPPRKEVAAGGRTRRMADLFTIQSSMVVSKKDEVKKSNGVLA